jgi:predicted DNA-binding transcriptional regulator YafY
VFQEEPIDVVPRFTPEVAEDAARWSFHPSQTLTREADGSLTVCFRAGGMQEMCWYLFTWGTAVKIVSPHELRAVMIEMLNSCVQHHVSRFSIQGGTTGHEARPLSPSPRPDR